MKVAIVDTQIEGHHLEYIYGLTSKLTEGENEVPVDLYCDHRIFDYIRTNNLADFPKHDNLKIKTEKLIEPKGNWFDKTKAAYYNIRHLSEYDHVLFLYANVYFPALLLFALFDKPEFQPLGIYFNPYVREKTTVKSWIKTAVLKLLIQFYPTLCLFVLNDEHATCKLNEKFGTGVFQTLRDPVPEFYYKDIDKNGFSLNPVTKFTMLGSISERKGVFSFLEAISKTKVKNKYILAGKVDKTIAGSIINKVDNLKKDGYDIELHDRFLSNREFARFVSETDILVIPYLTKGASSGILGHAAYANKHVIGPKNGFIGKLIKKYNLGYTVDPNDINSFARVMQTFGEGKRPTEQYRGSNYATQNSLNQFHHKIVSELI